MTGNLWQPIDSAPRDGSEIRAGWFANGRIEYTKHLRWRHDLWVDENNQGGWMPTHWRRADER